jgi:hypothetical protein
VRSNRKAAIGAFFLVMSILVFVTAFLVRPADMHTATIERPHETVATTTTTTTIAPTIAPTTTTLPPPPATQPPTTLPPAPVPTAAAEPEATVWPVSLQPCGGDLPPCYVKQRESGGDYSARNNTEPGAACGAWQIIGSTWAGFGGYAEACGAPPAVQDEKARQLWARGAGCSHWSAC